MFRYKKPADWGLISDVAQATPVPVIGNGDILTHYEVLTICVSASMHEWSLGDLRSILMYTPEVRCSPDHAVQKERESTLADYQSVLRGILGDDIGALCLQAQRRAEGSGCLAQMVGRGALIR
jgi:tRNA-dihydrouridine synthase